MSWVAIGASVVVFVMVFLYGHFQYQRGFHAGYAEADRYSRQFDNLVQRFYGRPRDRADS